ncbi:hypothetical protein ACOSP7_031377 [Xanthoceras sorbifolium]
MEHAKKNIHIFVRCPFQIIFSHKRNVFDRLYEKIVKSDSSPNFFSNPKHTNQASEILNYTKIQRIERNKVIFNNYSETHLCNCPKSSFPTKHEEDRLKN